MNDNKTAYYQRNKKTTLNRVTKQHNDSKERQKRKQEINMENYLMNDLIKKKTWKKQI